ncbi:thermonuclease family protein [Ferrovibrio sp.]|uniref:thermonuclease family protein n=1 Tax=Ferrovibrio sp. TaxID=1917215 RepID=UPI0025C6B6A4|nr:thermonuclease family protein [Ferrovibrio sp.]MBX3453370.1 thermonuclease family protein [Ferrovibrio sp.]
MNNSTSILSILGLALLPISQIAAAEPPLPGPVAVEQARVIDGDTMEVVALIWLDQRVTTRVRLEGIDTPEKRSKCTAEREAAEAATKLASDWLERNKPVVLRDLSHDKYGRRVVGRVQSADGRSDLGETLIAQGLARRYDGGTKRPWCP